MGLLTLHVGNDNFEKRKGFSRIVTTDSNVEDPKLAGWVQNQGVCTLRKRHAFARTEHATRCTLLWQASPLMMPAKVKMTKEERE
jgi:hypothetical protein